MHLDAAATSGLPSARNQLFGSNSSETTEIVGPELLPYEERLEEVGNSAWSRDFSLEEGCFHRLFTVLQDKRMRDNKHKPNEMFD